MTNGPSWKHRRRLIYASYVLGAGMIIFGAVTYLTDTQVGSQMVIGGVGLITVFEIIRIIQYTERILGIITHSFKITCPLTAARLYMTCQTLI